MTDFVRDKEEFLKYKSRLNEIFTNEDFGNMAAGIVAARAGIPDLVAKMKFGELQGGPEPPVSAKAQQIGLNIGRKLFWSDYGKRRLETPIINHKF